MSKGSATPPNLPWFQHTWLKAALAVLVLLVTAPLVAINASPRPGVVLIRSVFDKDSSQTKLALEKHAPTSGITVVSDIAYREDDPDAHLDVYYPESVDEGQALPTVIWTHGGAWISGDKEDASPYFQLLASEGYTVVSLNYSVGPDQTYPVAVHQLNEAHAFILANAGQFHVDVDQLFLAGDSAGAQLSSQLAAMATNPDFASELGVTPALQADQIRGVILNCGIYDMVAYSNHSDLPETFVANLLIWGTETALWAYTGNRSANSEATRQMSTINHVTAEYPPVWISGGNGDPLTDKQSKPFAASLDSLGVDVDTLFYAEDHEPALGHEYQFNLDNDDGQAALASMVAFINDQSIAANSPAAQATPSADATPVATPTAS